MAEALGDNSRASRVCQLAVGALIGYRVGLAMRTPEYTQWAERADRYAVPSNIFAGRVSSRE